MKKQQDSDVDLKEQEYKDSLRALQIELVKFQRHLIKNQLQILIIFEGRDTAGKDGVIKRMSEYLSPRETRVIALGPPSDHDRRSWYFKRYVSRLPSSEEMVLMNRSWYNRAGVERVMGFCNEFEYENFMESVVPFESMLVNSGMQLFKYYLDISKHEQEKRLEERRVDPLTQWKRSPIDEVASKHWNDYSAARNQMFKRTHHEMAPWYIVKADDKRAARLNLIRHFLSRVECEDKDEHQARPDSKLVFTYADKFIKNGAIAS